SSLAETEGLRAARRDRGCDGARRQLERVAVAEERLEPRRQNADDRVAHAFFGQLDLAEADLRLRHLRDARARGVCERLRAEAEPEHRRSVVDPRAQQLVLVFEPRVALLLADVRRAPEEHHRVELAAWP